MNTEVIVMFARHFGWTIDDIGKLSTKQTKELADELAYQFSVDDYKQRTIMALYTSMICTAITGKVPDINEIVGPPPLRAGEPPTEEHLLALAKQTRRRRRKENERTGQP